MNEELEQLRILLCDLGDAIRQKVAAGREGARHAQMAGVAHQTEADTIYEIDKLSEEALEEWFRRHWPDDEPVEVVFEGGEESGPHIFPEGLPVGRTKWKCIIDPIDGTRGIMYDKRSAWALAGIAPQRGAETKLSEIVVAAMTELPTTKQWRADQISVVRGQGIHAEAIDTDRGGRSPLTIQPSRAGEFDHGFASFAKFFPEGRALTSRIEELLWDQLIGLGTHSSPIVFDDQYISTGGQFYEVLVGHDRMVADLRPVTLHAAGFPGSLVCHPYDACAWPILLEAGCVFEAPDGSFPDAPLDTTTAIGWVAYANDQLARLARPALEKAMTEALGEFGAAPRK